MSNSNAEKRFYLISGERTPDEWDSLLRGLGESGLQVENALQDSSDKDQLIPYSLDEITTYDQYLSDEHAAEFWPRYRIDCKTAGIKAVPRDQAVYAGLNALLHGVPRDLPYGERLNDSERLAYLSRIGLDVVSPRSLVGFPYEQYKITRGQAYPADSVVRVGSLIAFLKDLPNIPRSSRPRTVGAPTIRYLSALVAHIESNISE